MIRGRLSEPEAVGDSSDSTSPPLLASVVVGLSLTRLLLCLLSLKDACKQRRKDALHQRVQARKRLRARPCSQFKRNKRMCYLALCTCVLAGVWVCDLACRPWRVCALLCGAYAPLSGVIMRSCSDMGLPAISVFCSLRKITGLDRGRN